jgi:hypothetical protein
MTVAFMSICYCALPMLLSVPGMPAHATELQSRETTMHQAKGMFDVKLDSQPPDNDAARSAGIGRMSLDKRYRGPLEATGAGEMLFSGDGTQSGAYVAIEKVSGRLDGREGSFVLVHHALMNRGTPEAWTVTVAPDSGTGGLAGLSGTLAITIADGEHRYDFRYTLDGDTAAGVAGAGE